MPPEAADERTFMLRFSLSVEIAPAAWDDEDFEGDAWLGEWEAGIKPGLIREVFGYLRKFEGWTCHVRNRGVSATDEIEIVMTRTVE